MREQLQIQWLTDRVNGTVARDPNGFRDAAQLAFGEKADIASTNALIDAARADALPIPPVRFVEPGALGANAHGAWDGRTIYLDRSLMSDPDRLERVFTEEFGHGLDTNLGGADSRGDEGEIFARTLLGEHPSPDTVTGLRVENDHGTIDLLGTRARSRPVEFSLGNDENGHAEGIGGDESGIGGGGSFGNDGETHNGDRPTPTTSRPATPEPPAPIPGHTGPNPTSAAGGARAAAGGPDDDGGSAAPVGGNDGETHNDRGRREPVVDRGRGLFGWRDWKMDVFVGVDLDLVAFGGGKFSTGYVLDLDAPSESGTFLSRGTAGGGHAGFGLTGGVVLGGELEGDARTIDVGAGRAGVGIGRGEDGGVTLSGTFGAGGGLSASDSHTVTRPFGRD